MTKKKQKQWTVTASIVGSKYIGEVEAETEEEAVEKGWEHENCHSTLCHHCSSECEDAEVDEIHVELVEKEEPGGKP